MLFSRLDDSPMFRKQVAIHEENAEALKERCQKFHKGCRKYMEGLQEAQVHEMSFLNTLEAFGGGMDDPLGESIGGPVMQKFTSALRDIASFKEVLRSQVEHMLIERLNAVINVDLNAVKDVRKRFDKTSQQYDQAREKFLALKRDSRPELKAELEEELIGAKTQFEQSRFNLVTALGNIESKKRFEFLEAVSAFMDAQLRYYKQSFDLLKAIEPYIHQVLTYAQQARERANHEQADLAERMHAFRRQVEEESARLAEAEPCLPNASGRGPYQGGAGAATSQKLVEKAMLSSARGKVQTIKQGYLLKRSTNLRADWRRRFFVLDSRGVLYYHRKPSHKAPSAKPASGVGGVFHSSVQGLQHSMQGLLHAKSPDPISSLFGRMMAGGGSNSSSTSINIIPSSSSFTYGSQSGDSAASTPAHSPPGGGGGGDPLGGSAAVPGAEDGGAGGGQVQHSVNLLTATIKVDAEQGDLRFCFRIVTPAKMYTLQAESASERADWMDKITAVIASLLNQHISQPSPRIPPRPPLNDRLSLAADGSGGPSAGLTRRHSRGSPAPATASPAMAVADRPLTVLRAVPGNHVCADCHMADPDWASLNLGILVCIECSGVHRNLGVHISKVRSTTLDVRAWEPGVMAYFASMGNKVANSIWEEALHSSPSLQQQQQQAAVAAPGDPGVLLEKQDSLGSGSGSRPRSRSSTPRHSRSLTVGDSSSSSSNTALLEEQSHVTKPGPRDPLPLKEKFIQAKYGERRFVARLHPSLAPSKQEVARKMWGAVASGNHAEATRLLVVYGADVNTTQAMAFGAEGKGEESIGTSSSYSQLPLGYGDGSESKLSRKTEEQEEEEIWDHSEETQSSVVMGDDCDPPVSHGSEQASGGATLLHLVCQKEDIGGLEMLIQYGANLNVVDETGQTALHRSIASGSEVCARMLLNKGILAGLKDSKGRTAMDIAVELGKVADDDLFVMLTEATAQ